MGGLGNQMFQYAAARRLALLQRTELKIDLSWLNTYPVDATPRRYELGHLSIAANIANSSEISRLTGTSGVISQRRFIRSFFNRTLAGSTPEVFRESHFQFNPVLLDAPDSAYLDGYWQSEKYFLDVADIIRKDYALKSVPDAQNELLAESITRVLAVSVHVRRGDYVNNPSINSFHGVCPSAYYHSAMELMAQKTNDPHFFIFSDDIQWCKKNIKTSYPVTYVDHNGPEDAHFDLWLMSQCRYHIIANSTLSWWGAWLNPQSDKIVIAPLRWFNDPTIDTSDLIPASWMRIAG